MKTRIITGVALVAVLVPILIFSDTAVFPAFCSLAALLGMYEMLRCIGTESKLGPAVQIPACTLAAITPIGSFLLLDNGRGGMVHSLIAGVFLAFLLYLFAVAVLHRGKMTFGQVSSVFAAALYVILGCTFIVLLRHRAHGQFVYILVLLGCYITDTFAYFTGRFFGRHKLIEEISPKKTVEGSIGGILFCIVSFLVYGIIVEAISDVRANYLLLAVVALLLSVVSQFGDLITSLIKREHGVKDYGNIFPGHGGMMDRIDSLLSVAIALYIATADGWLPAVFY